MTIHTIGEHLGFHPHLNALVADGSFNATADSIIDPNQVGGNRKKRFDPSI
ncbi:transposase [Pontiella desulfatans]|uniref:transposase n=1 Tax=Pontiella desulfatans TaxID=2750659 RepID=UPI001443F6B7|nr:transposase [Pontiella desulfatans]